MITHYVRPATRVDHACAIPFIGNPVDLNRRYSTRAVRSKRVIIATTDDTIIAAQHIATDITSRYLPKQGVNQVVEVIDQNRGLVGISIEVNIFETILINTVAHPNRCDTDAIAGQETLPIIGHTVFQRITTRSSLLVRIAITDKEHLVIPARNRAVRHHGLFNGISEIGLSAERPISDDVVDQRFEGCQCSHWRISLRIRGESH